MILTAIVIILVLLILIVWLYMQLPQFGRAPRDKRLQHVSHSPNYKEGTFQNLSNTPSLTEGVSMYTVLKEFFFGKSKRVVPSSLLPSKKVNLLQLPIRDNVLVWFGHSSYFMQLDGKRILVDPVFSGNASPFSFTTKSFNGSDVYTAEEMPVIDYLFISHDHFDHLDYKTVVALLPKVKKVITGLGVGSHLLRWGYEASKVIESDWNEQVVLDPGFVVHTAPARHFSGRKFKRNTTLWMSFVLATPTLKIYMGGDSGYDTHFAAIGNQHGPFDLVILENGQYNKNWKYIHMMPEEVVQAAIDLKAKQLLPVHWSKFALAIHDWDEPILRVIKEAEKRNMQLLTPIIGEVVFLNFTHAMASADKWWEKIH